jgi:PAS domain S-box-containing protein
MTAKNFGNRLRLLRSVHNVTQAELARRVNITAQHVSRIEMGMTSPSFPLIDKICLALDIEPSALFLFPDDQSLHRTKPSIPLAEQDGALSRLGRLFTWTGVWIFDQKLKHHVWSMSMYAMLGHKNNSYKASLRRFLRHVHPEDQLAFQTVIARTAQDGHFRDLFFRFSRKGGIHRHGLLRVEPLQEGDIATQQNVAFVSDVTEWHLLERSLMHNKAQLEWHVAERNKELSKTLEKFQQALRQSEKMARDMRYHERIVATSCDGHAYVDAKLIHLDINESYEAIIGLPREQIVGKHLVDIVGKEFFQTVVRSRVTQVLQGASASYEHWRQCLVKGRRYLHMVYTPCLEKKTVVGIAITVRDMTELKNMEERLQQCEERCRLESANAQNNAVSQHVVATTRSSGRR